MIKTLQVQTREGSYPIHIGAGLHGCLPDLLQEIGWNRERRLMLVTDDQVGPLYGEYVIQGLKDHGFQASCLTVPAGEGSKKLSQLEEMVGDCLQAGLDRSSAILALGGGVVGDLAGFLAASYMRGIPFIQLPTTLLAHDSSVGGKVGVNHPLGKNMIGAFHQPSMVVFDVNTLNTLPEREVASGYAEVVKHALIRDADFVCWLEERVDSLRRLEPDSVSEAIWRGCAVKGEVVSQDEKEAGLRAILNYGHTIGHALEATAGYGVLTHGEAVAIGMVGEAMLAEELGLCPPVSERTARLLSSFGLPTRLTLEIADEELLERMRRDKKVKQGRLTFILPREVGCVDRIGGVEEAVIRRALDRLRGGGEG
ncbi:3-dehydroquinate synthase [Kroppenstedtia sanguinis]|uniref:3-dehydroquinate synthase n=1 Tax=Kroppenstedtia sanguinis TaxID=1380684 RepID=A0ABW4CAH3_9BACL